MHGERELFIKSNTYGTFFFIVSSRIFTKRCWLSQADWFSKLSTHVVPTIDGATTPPHDPLPLPALVKGLPPSSASRTSDKTKSKEITHWQI